MYQCTECGRKSFRRLTVKKMLDSGKGCPSCGGLEFLEVSIDRRVDRIAYPTYADYRERQDVMFEEFESLVDMSQ